MPAKQPSCGISASGGLSFVNDSPNSNYRALRLDSTDNHLYWESTYQNILRINKDFGDFFPHAEFSDNGNQVTFTKYIDGVEILAKSRPMRPGELISRSEWERFLNSWQRFKALAEQSDVPEDIVKFIKTFRYPPFDIFPSAYRIYKPHWYSKPRLIMLWGLEPASPSEIPNVYDDDEVISKTGAYVEPEASQDGFNFIRLIKFIALGLMALVLVLILLWLLIPMPRADFQVSPTVNKPTKISNTSKLSAPNSNNGVTSYGWTIEKGTPNESKEFEPLVTWKSTGPSKVTLEVTQSILGGLLFKKDEKTKSINVMAEPVVVNPEPFKDLPDSNGFGLEIMPLAPDSTLEDKDAPEEKSFNNPESLSPSTPKETLPQNPKGSGAAQKQKPNEKALDDSTPRKDDSNPTQDNLTPKDDGKKSQNPQPDNGKGPNKDEVAKKSPGPSPGKNGNGTEPRRAIKPKSSQESGSTPRIIIINQSILSDGSESQKIVFSIEFESKVELNTLTIDGSEIDLGNTQKSFVYVLKKGTHRLELSYTDLDGNSDTIIQEIIVDSRPDNKLTPPVKKFKQSDLESLEESQPKQLEENFNKKLA